jgi:hypothetical protein
MKRLLVLILKPFRAYLKACEKDVEEILDMNEPERSFALKELLSS